MLHKIIGHGSNGSRGVMDYMLKEKDKRTPRKGATILRGDIETQSKLIDSLVGKFKQQYVTGVFSFEEAPDQITEAQKVELMDDAEKMILAGLDPNRVSITWIEHTDKDRLELNYIVACVDLEHGRLFQPYVHSHDQARFNAFRDIQNIKHGYSEPNDPAKAQNLSQTEKLPRTTKEIKEAINAELENQVIAGLIISRDDVKQALNELGYTITRAGKDYISIKNPDPKGQNIKFKSTNQGGLYDIKFNASTENASKISRASADFRASARVRYTAAQKIYDKEFDRKREYHQKRHSKPKFEHRGIAKPVNPAFARYTAFDRRYANTVPNPYTETLRNRNKRNSADDRELYGEHAELDRTARASSDRDSKNTNEALVDMGFNRLRNSDDFERIHWSNDSEISNRLTASNIQTRPLHQGKHFLPRDKVDEQADIRSSYASDGSEPKHDSSAETNNSMARARDQDERVSYSSIDGIIKSISRNSIAGAESVTDSIQGLTNLYERHNKRISVLDGSTKKTTNSSEKLSGRIVEVSQQAKDYNNFNEQLLSRTVEIGKYESRCKGLGAEVEHNTRFTERNRELTNSNQQLKRDIDEITGRNRVSGGKAEPIAIRLKELIATQEQAKKVVPSRPAYSSPRPF